jgi:hypothetical protein
MLTPDSTKTEPIERTTALCFRCRKLWRRAEFLEAHAGDYALAAWTAALRFKLATCASCSPVVRP